MNQVVRATDTSESLTENEDGQSALSTQDTVLILAPTGQDSKLAAEYLQRYSIQSEILRSVEELSERLRLPCGAVLLAEEALTEKNSQILKSGLSQQEQWSDLPVILLTSQKERMYRAKEILDFFAVGGSMSVLERPFRGISFISAVQVALRSRRRQYQVRDLLLEQIKAVKIRDEFLSLASHELKTPLTSLKLQVQMRQRFLKRGDQSVYSPEKVNALIETTGNQVDRLARLVDDMLDISRIENGKLTLNRERVELGELVQQVYENFVSQFEVARTPVTVSIECRCQGFWDRYRLEQVVTNLFTNALKYGAGKPVTVLVRNSGSKAILSVHDQGNGISPEDQERVFQRFERATNDSNISGLGLGLFITRQILEMHQGRIWLESILGKGSSFFVELPMQAQEGAPDSNRGL